jgi:hypothetical protein
LPVTAIGYKAFSSCTSLTSVTIPNSVIGIGDRAFQDCTSLTSITIPDSVTSIGMYAFYGCSSLASVTIPNSVTNIGRLAFYGCSSLASVTIPNSVTNIGHSTFSDTTRVIRGGVSEAADPEMLKRLMRVAIDAGKKKLQIGSLFRCTSHPESYVDGCLKALAGLDKPRLNFLD